MVVFHIQRSATRVLLTIAVILCTGGAVGAGLRGDTSAPAQAQGAAPTVTPTPAAQGVSPTEIQVTQRLPMTLQPTVPPPTAGPGPDPNAVVFLDDQDGFLASGPFYVAPSFAVTGPGLIQRTSDGGVTWITVWQHESTRLSSIGFMGTALGFAAGVESVYADDGTVGAQPIFLRSDDGGESWAPIIPTLPTDVDRVWLDLRFQFVSATTGFAEREAGRPNALIRVPNPLLRTTDGGRSWQTLAFPGRVVSGGLQFLSPTHGFATSDDPFRRPCLGELWETDDAGDTWSPVPGTCVPFELHAVDFLDGQRGFLAGGVIGTYTRRAIVEVLSTVDGGETWQSAYEDEQAPANAESLPAGHLHFVDAERGWLTTDGCDPGSGADPFCLGAVFSTNDGGHSWTDTGRRGVTWLATSASGRAWALGFDGHVIFRSADLGQTWQVLARPAEISIAQIQAAGSWLALATEAGTFLSIDDGASMQPFAPPILHDLPTGTLPDLVPPSTLAVGAGLQEVRVSPDDGLAWQRLTLPPDHGEFARFSALTFWDESDGLATENAQTSPGLPQPAEGDPLYRTSDGGQTWQQAPPVPLFVLGMSSIAGLVAAWGFTPSGSLSGPCVFELALSVDSGQSWQVQCVREDLFCLGPSVAPPKSIWLACNSGPPDAQQPVIFISSDGGTTWTEHDGPATAGGAHGFAAMSDQEAWMLPGRGLWRTTDGGSTWIQEIPPVPIEADEAGRDG